MAYLDENGNPIPPSRGRPNLAPQPPGPPPSTTAPPPTLPPGVTSTTPDANGLVPINADPNSQYAQGISPEQLVRAWQQQWGTQFAASDPASFLKLVNALRLAGYHATPADHNGTPSIDKIDFGDGHSADVIGSSGGADASWAWQPYGTGSSGGGGTLNGGLLSTYDTGPFTAPWPGTIPTYQQAPAFTPTTTADAEADPGYKFRLNEGQKALNYNAAARGLLNTGGTGKEFLAFNQGYASNEFANTDARRHNDYLTNYQTQYQDPYLYGYQTALQNYNIFRNRQNDSWDKVFSQESA